MKISSRCFKFAKNWEILYVNAFEVSLLSKNVHLYVFTCIVCLQLRNAIKFHFNYATPTIAQQDEMVPQAKRPQKKRAVTAFADVMAHLKRGQRNVVEREAPSSTHSTGPRTLSFTPQTTPVSQARQPNVELVFED